MSDVSLAQEKKELAKSKAIYDEKAEGLDRGMAKLEELSKAKFGELADRVVAADAAKQKYLEKLDEYITHENRLAAWHAAEQKKVDRWAATYDRMIADVRKYRDEEKELLAAAKKRKRDSTVVESSIIRKLVKRTDVRSCQPPPRAPNNVQMCVGSSWLSFR